MVEAASDFLMSSLAQPTTAPKTSVMAPTMTTTSRASGVRSKIGFDRTTRYTPAVTIVAAWMSADTGVGPAIASPSQDCSGNCADLPHAPSSSRRPIAVSVAVLGVAHEPASAHSPDTDPSTPL